MSQADRTQWEPKSFQTMEQLRDELTLMQTSHEKGELTTVGGWTVGQNLEHCAQFMKYSYDGFQAKMPAPIRILAQLLLKGRLTKPGAQMKPGIKLPKKAKDLLPGDQVSIEQGLEYMNQQVNRVLDGEQFMQESPLLGKLSHEQWVALHLNHCRMHFGFLRY